ncbi:MAG: Hsp20/alpha crystallin family protein [Euryarchaeota archaeon]|nr:Hsp20/alpha crystallin family protein [Euryarchaeota archaeon]
MGGIFDEFNWLVDTVRPSFDQSTRCLEPLVHVRDAGGEVVITADLPYVRKEDIKVHITEDLVEIEASMARSVTLECCGTIHSETRFRSFKKAVGLPVRVIPEKARARFSKGILEVRVPKKLEPRRIEIE